MTRIGSLFSGAGGLDMAVQAVFGGDIVWHCENDPAASKVLAAHYPHIPNHGDITTTDWNTAAPVDLLCGGWPCQPFSLAGQRKGAHDERALWPYVARAVRLVRPRHVVLENVSAVLGPEFCRVANDLAALGYDISWTCLRASDVGAPHRRERLFILATDTSGATLGKQPIPQPRCGGTPFAGQHQSTATDTASGTGRDAQQHDLSAIRPQRSMQPRECTGEHPRSGGNAPDSSRDGRHEGRPEPARLERGSDAAVSGAGPVELLPTPTGRDGKGQNQRGDDTCLTGALLPTPSASDGIGGGPNNPENRLAQGHHVQLLDLGMSTAAWGKYEPAIRRWETHTRPAPSPTEPNTKGNPRLNPAFSEWMMGWPDGWVTDVDGISRNDKLRIIGNGVCPQQAHAALQWLLSVCEAAA